VRRSASASASPKLQPFNEATGADGSGADHDGNDETDEADGRSAAEVMLSSGEAEISAEIERSTASIDCGWPPRLGLGAIVTWLGLRIGSGFRVRV
jgi:hypothetical protein